MLRSIYHQNKHNFFFPGRLNFNEHVNSNHITKFLCLKLLTIYVCGKKKVMNFMARIIMTEWKWRLETKCRFPTWCFGWSTRTHQHCRSVPQESFIHQCQQHIEPMSWSIPRFTYHLKHLNRLLNIPDFLLFYSFSFSNDPWS